MMHLPTDHVAKALPVKYQNGRAIPCERRLVRKQESVARSTAPSSRKSDHVPTEGEWLKIARTATCRSRSVKPATAMVGGGHGMRADDPMDRNCRAVTASAWVGESDLDNIGLYTDRGRL